MKRLRQKTLFTRKRLLLLSALLPLSVALGVLIWISVGKNEASEQRPPNITGANAAHLGDSLSDKDREKQSLALSKEIRNDFLQQGQSMLPEGVDVVIHPDTFKATNNDIAEVEATTSDQKEYPLHLIYESDMWLILYTSGPR